MRKALTVGELLITMTIIGVIAILVIPGFIKDYHNKLYTVKFKKSYEMFSSAIEQACIDSNVSTFSQTPYSTPTQANHQAFIDKYFKKAGNNNTNPFATKYAVLNTGTEGTVGLAATHGWAKLASGEAISFWCNSKTTHCVYRVDINSTDGPNIGGRDYFVIYVNNNTNEIYDKYGAEICGTDRYGEGCLSRLIKDNWVMKY